jgi:hypothetical protein
MSNQTVRFPASCTPSQEDVEESLDKLLRVVEASQCTYQAALQICATLLRYYRSIGKSSLIRKVLRLYNSWVLGKDISDLVADIVGESCLILYSPIRYDELQYRLTESKDGDEC